MREGRPWRSILRYRVEVAWVVFVLATVALLFSGIGWPTVPFHLVWLSLAVVYAFRVWPLRPTLAVLGVVGTLTGAAIYVDYLRGFQELEDLCEVPLLGGMFLAVVWHAQRRRAEVQRTRRLLEANERLVDQQRRFIEDASHELRTPITIALGHVELIARLSSGGVRDAARVAFGDLMRLRRLSDRLLLLAAIDTTNFVQRRPVEVEPILVETIRRWAPVPRRWRLGQVDEVRVEADPDRLAVAIDALIENAVKFSSREDSIELSASRRGRQVALCVTDSGRGIASEHLERVFDRFTRADAVWGRNGLGLGLAIVREIVVAHGGSVQAHSRLGEGATFEMLLPALDGEAPA